MKRFSQQLLGALFVFGCGSGAAAAPNHGQWMDYDPQNPSTDQAASPAAPTPSDDDQVAMGCPDMKGQMQGQAPSQGAPPQSNTQPPAAMQPPQDQSATPDQDQDEDSAETFAPSRGQSHLGVVVMTLTPELRQFWHVPSDRGVLIAKVQPGSAAERAGIHVGDVLVRVGPRPVRSGEDVLQALAAHAGGRIRVAVIRQGRAVRLDAYLPERQPENQDQI